MLRKRKYYFLTALLITLLFCIPFYQSSVFTGLDLSFHLSRIQGILTSIADHQFPLALYPDKNFGFGYASPLFYCDLFLLPASFLYALHMPILLVYKIYVFFISFLGTCLCLSSMRYLTEKDHISIFCTIVFVFSSYHINDFFIRAALGEAMAFSLLPAVILAMYRYLEEGKENTLELAAGFSLLALSHLITFALTSAVFAVLLMVYAKRIAEHRHWLPLVKAVGIGFVLCAFFLIPLLQQMRSQEFQYARNRALWGEEIMRNYSNTLLSALSDYLLLGHYDLEAHHYFTGLTVVLTPLFYLTVKKEARNRFMTSVTVISVILLIATTDLIPLYKISFLQSLQFTYRFNILIASFLPAVLACTLSQQKKQIQNTVMILSLLYITANTGVIYHQLIHDPDQTRNDVTTEELFTGEFYENYNNHYNVAELASGEYLPAAHQMDYEALSGVYELFDTEGSITGTRSGSETTIQVNAASDGYATLPVSWYLGYAAEEVSPGSASLPCIRDEYTGRIVLPVSAGEHSYRIYYKGTTVQKGAAVLSLLGGAVLMYWLIRRNGETH